jgi:hypothetical protein
MTQKKANLPRAAYNFPAGTINWREIEPDPQGGWPGIYGNVETEQIITR